MTGRSSGKRRGLWLAPLLLFLPAALLWLYAEPLAGWTARRYLDSLGIEMRRLDGLELGLSGLDLEGLILANEEITLEAAGIRADFALPRIGQVEISRLRLEVPVPAAGGAGTVPELAAMLETLHELPLGGLEIEELRIAAGATEFSGRLLAAIAPLRVEFEIESPWPISLRLSSAGADDISGNLAGPGGLQISFEGNVAGDVIDGAVEASLSPRELGVLFEIDEGLPAGNVEVAGPFRLKLADSDFTFTSPGLFLDAPELVLNELTAVRARLQLDQVVVRYWRASALEAGRWYALSYFDSNLLELPYLAPARLNGSWQLSGSGLRGAATLAFEQQGEPQGTPTVAIAETARVSLELLHRFDDAAGFADIEVHEFRLSSDKPLSSFLSLESPQGDVVAGAIAGAGGIEWTGGSFDGGMLLRLEDLSGFFAETAFFDLDTDVNIELTQDFALRNAAPLEATLARIDPGLPLEELRWNYSFDSAGEVLEIRQLQAAWFDGLVTLPSLRLQRGLPLPDVNLVLTDIDLAAVTGLANYDDLAVTGRVSGYLPIRIEPDGVRIEDGLIGALQPGGTVRYAPRQPASDPRMRTVNELLSDYRFETLNSYVQLDASGDLRLQTRITGTNPTVNPDQPINLNVNITDNIPELLRSLRAGREISRVLEEHLNRQ